MLNPRVLLEYAVAVILLSGATQFLQLAAQTKPGCTTHCGDQNITYPFGTIDGGTGSDCYYDTGSSRSFVVFCDKSENPPVLYWNNKSSNIPIVDISVKKHETRIMTLVARDCYSSLGKREYRSQSWATLATFHLSSAKNRFTVVGCDTFAFFESFESSDRVHGFVTGCTASCSSINEARNGSCLGFGCCQTNSLPRDMTIFNITLESSSNYTSVHAFNPCGFAFFAANDYFKFSTASLQNITEERMPVVLDWAVGNQTCMEAQNDTTSYMCKENTNCTNVGNGQAGYRCHCNEGYQGNPYLSGQSGCQDIDECSSLTNQCHERAKCENEVGTYRCYCRDGYTGDGKKDGSGCTRQKYNSRDVALGVGMGCLLLLLFASWLALWLRQRKATKERERFFKDNGGLMLQRILSQHRGYVETLKVFTAEELRKATENYHESKILGQGGQGTVYKGTVMHDRVVAIKKAKKLDRSQVNEFINEVIVLSQINHKNVVKLIGCCLETELPLLVYEFVTNGTLSKHLHDNDRHSSTSLSSWGARLRVAVETAGALSYLHSEATITIVHRDVKSTNILLDENFTAKVSDFGASRFMPSDKTQLSTLVQGTFGYLDPEYFHSSQLTEKSDVYSFGVVLAELLTGMEAISFDKPEKERTLSLVFMMAVKEDRCSDIIDRRIINEGNAKHIKEVALLTSRCLRMRGEERPSMKEVALELEGLLRATEQHPWVQHQDSYNIEESEYLLGGRGTSADYPDTCPISYPNTGTISTTRSEDTMKNQLIPFRIEDAR